MTIHIPSINPALPTPNMNVEDFCKVLYTLMSVNNEQRKEAERVFENAVQQSVAQALRNMLVIISTPSCDQVIRTFAAVLMRRAVERRAESLSEQEIAGFKTDLLQTWKSVNEHRLSTKLSHVLAQMAVQSTWPALMPQVMEFAMVCNSHALPALNLIEITADYCPEDINAHSQLLSQFLARFLAFEDANVRMGCAKAAVTCIAILEDDTIRNSFRAAVDPILVVLNQALSEGDEVDATMLLDNLTTVAQIQPVFFKPMLDKLVGSMLAIVSGGSLEFSTRSMALEWLITVAETAPAMVRRCNGFIKHTVGVVMQIMLDVDDDVAAWIHQAYNEEGEDENALTGDEAIERLSASLGGKSISEAVLEAVQGFSQKADWQSRRAAVAALCRLAEGSTKNFEKYLQSVVPFLLACLQDSAVRVQYEGIQTVGRLTNLFPEQCGAFIDSFLPLLATMLQRSDCCARVRGHAASALINMLNPTNCDAESLEKYIHPLLAGLLSCLQSAPYEVRSPCLVVLGCVAQVCPEQFSNYYGQFMPGIKGLLREVRTADLQALELRGRAIECAGLIGEAVGVKNFAQDAREVVQIFIDVLQADADQDIAFEYILPACARLSKALGAEFVPYLPVVFGPLLAGANQAVQFSMEDADEDEGVGEVVHDDETGLTVTVVSFAAGVKKRLSINTHTVQQKQQAARILFELAEALGPHLGVYLVPSLQTLSQLIGDKHSNDLRSSAALALSKNFHAYLQYQRAAQQIIHTAGDGSECVGLYQLTVRQLISAIRIEPDITTRTCLVECLRDVLQSIYELGTEQVDGRKGRPFLIQVSQAEATEVVSSALTQCAECVLRYNDKEAAIAKGQEKYDEEDLLAQREELEEEQELLTVLVDTFGQLIKLQQADFMPTFDKVVAPAFSSYMQPDKAVPLQILACCLIDDALEFGGEAAHKYLPAALQAFLRNASGAMTEGLEGDDLVLAQCSVYGLAVICKVTPPSVLLSAALVPALTQVLLAFVTIVKHPNCHTEDMEGVLENALYGIGCLLSQPAFQPFLMHSAPTLGVQVTDLSRLWLQALPLKTDAVEARDSVYQVTEALANRNELICGSKGEHVPDMLRVLAEALKMSSAEGGADDGGILHPVTAQRVAQLLAAAR